MDSVWAKSGGGIQDEESLDEVHFVGLEGHVRVQDVCAEVADLGGVECGMA
jgi:hypothetical protein